MSVTQKEIAEKLNVSQSYVARALSDNARISEATRRRIQEAAREMGYDSYANLEARTMVSRRRSHQGKLPVKNGILAVLFEIKAGTSPRNMPFYGPVFEGIEAYARSMGLDICFCPTPEGELPRLIRERRVDGVIMLIGHATDSVERIKEVGLPVVAFGNYSESTDYVTADDYDGGRQATRHLLDLGHRHIGFVGIANPEKHAGTLRLQGYLDMMRENGISVRDEWVLKNLRLPKTTPLLPCIGCNECAACIGWQTLKSRNGVTSRTKKLPFTGLVCHNDTVAMGVINNARVDGFEVPHDFSVVGFDNVSENYHFTPQVTSVDISLRRMGEDAVKLLSEVIDRQKDNDEQADSSSEYLRPVVSIVPVNMAIHATTQSLEK
jgi:DNA-binding LacI/PurR family transcriptional regulator